MKALITDLLVHIQINRFTGRLSLRLGFGVCGVERGAGDKQEGDGRKTNGMRHGISGLGLLRQVVIRAKESLGSLLTQNRRSPDPLVNITVVKNQGFEFWLRAYWARTAVASSRSTSFKRAALPRNPRR